MSPQIQSALLDNLMISPLLNVYCKDKQGKYLEINQGFKRTLLTLSMNEKDVIGQKDRDLLWANQAPHLEQNDQKIMRNNTSRVLLEPCLSQSEIKIFVSQKSPLYDSQNKIIGVFGISFLLEEMSNSTQQPNQLLFIKHLTNKSLPSIPHNLTNRQIDCLYYLVKGMTIKEIAKTIKLAPRTVEHYLETTREKLNCHSRSELFSKAFQLQAIREKLLF